MCKVLNSMYLFKVLKRLLKYFIYRLIRYMTIDLPRLPSFTLEVTPSIEILHNF